MNHTIMSQVRASALKMGGCDPLWLRDGAGPEYKTHIAGAEGPPIVLLHGLFGALSNWESTAPHLQKFSKTIALQFPLLTAHRSEVKVKALAAYTEYYVRNEKLAPAILCGNSLGGHVAMRLCLAAPELVDCLILSGTSGLYEHTVDSLPIRPSREFIREHMERVFYNASFITEEAITEILEVLSNRKNHLNLIHAARSAKKDNLMEYLQSISVPTLLLWGEDDQVTTMHVAELFHKNIRNSKLVTVKNCGHAPMIEHPDWFAKEVEKFLRDNGRLIAHKI